MDKIITDLTELSTPSEQLEFLDETGIHKEEGQEIINKITEVMEADKSILALSAPQIGIKKRIFCIRFNDTIKTFINPILKKKSGQVISIETNASLPNKEIAICRPTEIEVTYYNEEFKYEDNKFLNSAAKVFEQQYQLLDGVIPGHMIEVVNSEAKIEEQDILALVYAETSGGGFVVNIESEEDHLTSDDTEQLAQILGSYCDIFKAIGSSLRSSENKAIKYLYENLERQEQVILGKIQLIAPEPKMNREQRRAAEKQAKKIKTKKAGK